MSSASHDHTQIRATRSLRWLAFTPLAAFALLTLASPSDDGPTLCPVVLLTGMACPGCGMSRAVAWLIRGDLGRSLDYHPLAPLVVAMGWTAVVWTFGWMRLGWKAPRQILISAALIGLGILLAGVWITRFVSGTLPPV